MKLFEIDDQLSIFEQQGQLVVKSNDLIRKTRHTLSAQEQKVILFLISKIKPDDEDFQEYEFDISEFCKVCNIDHRSGGNYETLKEAIKNLRDKSFWVDLNGEDVLCAWVEKPKIVRGKSIVKMRLDNDLKPYLLQLRENFTSYELFMTLAMKGKYSIRLYEILKSHAYIGFAEYEIDHLKLLINAANYPVYNNFKVRVLDKAIGEINKYTDLTINFQPKRTGRNITSLQFTIEKKQEVIERISAMNARNYRLDKRGKSNE